MSKKIIFFDEFDNIILKTEMTDLPLKDNYVVNKSFELFSDPEPCIIHRTFIIKNFYIKLDDFINESKYYNPKLEFCWSKIPEYIRNAINLDKVPAKFSVYE